MLLLPVGRTPPPPTPAQIAGPPLLLALQAAFGVAAARDSGHTLGRLRQLVKTWSSHRRARARRAVTVLLLLLQLEIIRVRGESWWCK